MLRNFVNRKNRSEPIDDQSDQYFRYSPLNVRSFKHPRMLYFHEVQNQTNQSFKSIAFKNFACLDAESNKFYLNLDSLADYEHDNINFVSTIGLEFHKQSSNNLIDISSEPFQIVDGISYFMLSAQSCQIDILKLLYVLSQSIYIHSSYLPELEANISKAVNLDDVWDFQNNLFIVRYSNDENYSGFRTEAETKQLSKQRKEMSENQEIVISFNLERYFSEGYVLTFKNVALVDLDQIKENILNKYSPLISRSYMPASIMKGCTELLGSLKPLPVRKFHEINASIITEELENRTMANLKVFRDETFEKIGEYAHNQKNMKVCFYQIECEILAPFTENRMSWLKHSLVFNKKMENIKQIIEQQFTNFLQTEQMKKCQEGIKKLNKQSGGDASKIIGVDSIAKLPITFKDYKQAVKNNLNKFIESLTNNKWRGQDQIISNNNDFLANLETRIEINQRKKQGLDEAITLAKKEQDYLNQLVFSYKQRSGQYKIVSH